MIEKRLIYRTSEFLHPTGLSPDRPRGLKKVTKTL
jgi:hypothetical protein